MLLDIAAALDKAHDGEAFALIDGVAQAEIVRSQGRYEQAVDLVQLACNRLDATAAQQYLALLQDGFKAKRNFIKALTTLSLGTTVQSRQSAA